MKKGAFLDIKVQRRGNPQMNTANSKEASNFESGRIHEEYDWIHNRGWKDVPGATESIWAEKTNKNT